MPPKKKTELSKKRSCADDIDVAAVLEKCETKAIEGNLVPSATTDSA
jgi:hypothetical protein